MNRLFRIVVCVKMLCVCDLPFDTVFTCMLVRSIILTSMLLASFLCRMLILNLACVNILTRCDSFYRKCIIMTDQTIVECYLVSISHHTNVYE